MTIFFVITFVGRQGSSYLEGLLHSHPQASCLGEIFAPGELSQTTSIPDYLDEKVVNATCTASGFKLSIFHIQDKPDIVPVLRDRNYRIVRLKTNWISSFPCGWPSSTTSGHHKAALTRLLVFEKHPKR